MLATEPDATAAAQHAQHLAGRTSVIRREHRAKRRQHGVETAVVERQVLGIGDLKHDVEAFCGGARAAFLE